jgi:glucose-6-phosphate 1-dehydrogenase
VDYSFVLDYTGLMSKKAKNPLVFIIFGATGDLATRKIIPALVEIWKNERDNLLVMAFSRRPWTDEEYRDFLEPRLKEKKIPTKVIDGFLQRVIYVAGTFGDKNAYRHLHDRIIAHERGLAKKNGGLNILCHLAIEPAFYKTVARGLAEAELGQKIKIMIEKPFGSDYRSAKEIRYALEKYFPEENIYHVDHYLAKKGLRKVMETRLRDKKFENRLNGKYLTAVNLDLLEAVGIEGRPEFFENVGAIRDVGQNHMMEMLLAATMDLPLAPSSNSQSSNSNLAEETPTAREIAALRKNRQMILQSLKLVKSSVKQAQCRDYRHEAGVHKKSKTETAFAFDLNIDLPRWRGVRFAFRAGKYLHEQKGIEFVFKNGQRSLFPMEKTASGHADAYKTLIELAFAGDQSYFVGPDDIMAEWKIIDEVREQSSRRPLIIYKKGAKNPFVIQ